MTAGSVGCGFDDGGGDGCGCRGDRDDGASGRSVVLAVVAFLHHHGGAAFKYMETGVSLDQRTRCALEFVWHPGVACPSVAFCSSDIRRLALRNLCS